MSLAMKMPVKYIILLLISRRQIYVRICPTPVIIEPCSKRSGSLANILNATFLTSDKIDYIIRITIKIIIDGKLLACFVTLKNSS